MFRIVDVDLNTLRTLLNIFDAKLKLLGYGEEIPGSYWGGVEAGLIGNTVFVRPDTPIHSVLHEFCHYICMDDGRRQNLHTDAGGDDLEECAVCYLQILLADRIPDLGRDRLMSEMDDWGYSFRLGTAKQWFENDAHDARAWLIRHRLIDQDDLLQEQLRF